ncbi:MAG: hypothetical protein H6657_15260 [Ardenticatenaceae bacterium]|nr:hypothetical protein [Ardenticatenaceae bacterium]
MNKIIYLDTNILLHYQPFDQINWPKIVNAKSVTIVFPPLTIRELNNHKELHPRPHIKKRAGEMIKRLFGLFSSGPKTELTKEILVYFEDRDPTIDFSAHQLNPSVQDDHLIASIIRVFPKSKKESQIVKVVVTKQTTTQKRFSCTILH